MKRKTFIWIAGAITWFAATFILQSWAVHMVRETVTCHSTAEDSTPYDCDYDGKTHTWTRR